MIQSGASSYKFNNYSLESYINEKNLALQANTTDDGNIGDGGNESSSKDESLLSKENKEDYDTFILMGAIGAAILLVLTMFCCCHCCLKRCRIQCCCLG